MKKTLPFLWRYLAIVTVSCLLAFTISQSKVNASAAVPRNSIATPAPAPMVAPAPASTVTYETAGPFEVVAADAIWRDESRNRDIPVRIFSPKTSDKNSDGNSDKAINAMFPVILFSHGLGGSREGGAIWGQHWASHGYIVLHMQHAGSDEAVWKDKKIADKASELKSAMTVDNSRLRIGDVGFVLDQIAKLNKAKIAPWMSADMSHIGMSGHSFGAQTTLAVAGQKLPMPGFKPTLDGRITAAIAFSPNARFKTALDTQFGSISMPFFSITGTKDGAILNDDTKAEDRLIPYQKMPAGEKYLAVFDGGDHMVFGGHILNRRRPETARDRDIQGDVKAATLAFWDSTLKRDSSAQKWLTSSTDNGFKTMLAAGDMFEYK